MTRYNGQSKQKHYDDQQQQQQYTMWKDGCATVAMTSSRVSSLWTRSDGKEHKLNMNHKMKENGEKKVVDEVSTGFEVTMDTGRQLWSLWWCSLLAPERQGAQQQQNQQLKEKIKTQRRLHEVKKKKRAEKDWWSIGHHRGTSLGRPSMDWQFTVGVLRWTHLVLLLHPSFWKRHEEKKTKKKTTMKAGRTRRKWR